MSSTLKLSSAVPADALYVAPGGLDSNSGTSAQPLKTLAKAMSKVKAGQTIVFRQGVYREGATGPNIGGTYYYTNFPKNVTIRSYPGETVFLDGTEVVPTSAWKKVSANHYTTPWSTPDFCAQAYYSRSLTNQTSSGPCAYHDAVNGTTVLGDPQMVFRNDKELKQVPDTSKLTADTFYYDWKNKVLHIGFDPAGSTVAATKYAQAAAFFKADGLTIQGIGIRRYATNQFYNATAGALLLNSGTNVTLDRVVLTENAGGGLLVWQSSNLTIRRSYLSNNGANGFNFSGSASQLASNSALKDNLVVENTRIEKNNTESFGLECTYSCSSAGAKLGGMVGATIRYSSFSDNGGGRASGLWCDLDCRDVKIYGNRIEGNARHGVVYEVSDRGVIASNLIANNGWGIATHGGGYGIFSGSANTRIYNNTIIDNKMGVFLFDDPRSRGSATGYDYNSIGPDSKNVEFVNNILSTGKASSILLRVAGGTSTISTNTSATQVLSKLDHNSYAKTGKITLLNWQEYSDKQSVNYGTLNEFRTAKGTGHETNGQFTDSATNPHVKAASSGDYTTKTDLPAGTTLPTDIATLIGAPSNKAIPRGTTTIAK